jgi:hypothetical protein
MSLALYFLRHGETPYTASGAYCGILNPDLTLEGQQMAEAFAAAHQTTPWAGIYVLGRYRDRLEMRIASVSVVKFGKYGPLLQRLGDRTYLDQTLQDRNEL